MFFILLLVLSESVLEGTTLKIVEEGEAITLHCGQESVEGLY